MRRSELRRGKTMLKRRAPLARSGTLRVKPKRPLFDERQMRAEFHDHVVAQAPKRRGRRVCPVCEQAPTVENPLQAHHVTEKQAIKKLVAALQLPPREAAERLARLLWDLRNGLPVCLRCHSRHTSAYRRIPAALLTKRHRQFARELGLEHLLSTLYAAAPGGRERREAA